MPMSRSLARSFAGGEVTPEFYGRIDDAKYQTGLALCRNFLTLPHGPAANRPGTRYVNTVKDSTKAVRLIPFSYSNTQTMVIEVGDKYMRFHTQGATLTAGSPAAYNGGTTYNYGDLVSSGGLNYYSIQGSNTGHTPASSPTWWYAMPASGIYEIPTPYAVADIFGIHFVESQDVMTLVHQNYPPAELRRVGATNWQLINISFASPLAAPGSVTATATTGTGSTTYSYKVTALDSTGTIESLPGGPASCTNNLLTTGNKNTIGWAAVTGASAYNVYENTNGLYGFIGQTTGTSFVDNNINPDVSKTPPISNNPFSGAGNYPGAVSYFEQRRVFAGTLNQPQNFWMTRSGTESDLSYAIPTRDDDSIAFRVAAREASPILHAVPLLSLVFLTGSAEWRVTSLNSDALTPTTTSISPQSYIGSNTVQPIVVNNNLVFCAARGGHLREMAYSWQYSGYITGDLCLRAPHLFDNNSIVDMAYAKAPYPIVWLVSSTGQLIGLTYVPEQQIGAFHHHDTGASGVFESVTTVAEGAYDAVYVVVRRVINGSSVRYIERFGTRIFNLQRDAYFVDCGATYDNPITITGVSNANPGVITAPAHGLSNGNFVDINDVVSTDPANATNSLAALLNGQRFVVANATTNTFTLQDTGTGANISTSTLTVYASGGTARKAVTTFSGVNWLEGQTISILGDGAVRPQVTVTGGSFTLDQPASVVQFGIPITSDLQTLPLAYEGEQAFGQGRQKNVTKVYLRVFRSSGIFVGPTFNATGNDRLVEVKERTDEPYGVPPALISNEVSVVIKPSWGSGAQVCVRQQDPLPLTICDLVLEAAIGG